MAAENSTLFSLNIGDSLTNNAWGKGRWEGGSKKGGEEGRHKRRVGVREGGTKGGRVLYGMEGGREVEREGGWEEEGGREHFVGPQNVTFPKT